MTLKYMAQTHFSLTNFMRRVQNPEVREFVRQIRAATGVDTLDFIPTDSVFFEQHEKSVFTYNGDDGIIEKIYHVIGYGSKTYLDFGATKLHNNSQNLHVNHGFTGTLWGGEQAEYTTIHDEFVTCENVKELIDKYSVPENLDFLSIDIDGNDWHIWREITKYVKPRVVVIEYNGEFRVEDDKVIPYDPKFSWDFKTNYFGATLMAHFKLGRHLGYSLVSCNSQGCNAFFVRDDCIPDTAKIYGLNEPRILYRSLHATRNPDEYFENDKNERPWTSAQKLLESDR